MNCEILSRQYPPLLKSSSRPHAIEVFTNRFSIPLLASTAKLVKTYVRVKMKLNYEFKCTKPDSDSDCMCLVNVGCTGQICHVCVLVETPIIFETYTDAHKKDAVVLGYY